MLMELNSVQSYLGISDLKKLSATIKEQWTQQELEDMMQIACGSSNGRVSSKELSSLIKRLGLFL